LKLGIATLISNEDVHWSRSTICQANAQAAELMDYPMGELLGKMPAQLHQSATYSHIEQNIAMLGYSSGEIPILRNDGSIVWANHFVSPLVGCPGQMSMFVSIYQPLGTDLTGQDDRLQAIFHASTDSIISINSDGIVTDMNFATTRMFGYSRDELIGNNVSLLMPEPIRSRHNSFVRRYLETGIPSIIGRGRELIAQRKDGTTFPIELLVDEVDHRGVFMGIIRDVSERKRLEKQIVEISSDEQRRIGRELHDGIGQQLTGLGLYAGALSEILNGSIQTGSMNKSASELPKIHELLLKLTSGIKDTARSVQALSRGIVPVLKDSEGLWQAIEEMVRSVDGVQNVRCRFVHSGQFHIGDSDIVNHLFRIAQEGLSNALKHSHAQEVVVTLERLDGRVVLEVCDDGIGIDSARLSSEESNGAGFRILRYRADLIGAQVNVAPREGGGTKIRCSMQERGY
jgi:two-component system CheB/CheR fusion protein